MNNFKTLLYPILYWVIFIIIPFIIIYVIGDKESTSMGVVMLYILFIAPFLFVIPYKLSLLSNRKKKILFVILGLVLPYILVYLYVYLGIVKTFENSNFPF